MTSNSRILCFLALGLAALAGCSSEPAKESKKTAITLDKIQGKAQVLDESGTADAALNAGGSSIYLWEGMRRYRLFLRTPVDVVHGNEYVVEGVNVQKAIDDIGDPDQGKNGYPLQASCQRAVTMAWNKLSFDEFDATVSLVKARVNRYPARPLFLVVRLRPATAQDVSTVSAEPKDATPVGKDVPEVAIPAEKQQAALIAGPTVETAPLWAPAGGTVHCKVLINPAGKVSDLETGAQLCETVPWSEFRYQPPVQAGHPVKVRTEVEVRFEPRK
jgi:hypothetical protein